VNDPDALASALRDELAAARALAATGRALLAAMRAGGGSPDLDPLVTRHAEALEAAQRAARNRCRFLNGAGELDRWIAACRPANAAELSALGAEARELREGIKRDAEQAAYLARRVTGWYEAQRAWIVELVAREVDPGYGSAAGARLASAIDRSA
jgi:hypothetical protein